MVHGLIVKMNHPEFLFPFLSSLDQEDFFHSNLDGNQIGAAHYNDGRIYLQKSPFNRENFILDEFAQENIESSVYLLGTEFRPQGRSFQSPKAQPFSYKTWTAYFDIDNRDKIESQLIPPLMAKLPVENFVKSNCASKKVEEVYFALLLNSLFKNLNLMDHKLENKDVQNSMESFMEILKSLELPTPRSFLITNGILTGAYNQSNSIFYRMIEGLDALPNLPKNLMREKYQGFKAIFLSQNPSQRDYPFLPLDPKHFILIDREMEISLFAL